MSVLHLSRFPGRLYLRRRRGRYWVQPVQRLQALPSGLPLN